MIPYGRQSVSEEDIAAVVEALRSDWLTQGPAIERFEQVVARSCGAAFAVAVNSATSALHIACLAAGLCPGDVLWTSPNTFVASANCALYCGAEIDFVDIDPRTYNISVPELERRLAASAAAGRLPKVIVPVHFAGQSCDMEAIRTLADAYGCRVIEDASHAIGGRYKGRHIGSGDFSDMTVFSFHPVKIVTSGEGGMVVTNSRETYERIVRLRNHGITRDPVHMVGESHGPWYYEQIELGFNYRMTDIQAALGASQMERLDEFVSRRHYLAARYDKALADLPLVLPWRDPTNYSAFHLYVIRLRLNACISSHCEIFETLRRAGIGVNLHYIPVYLQPYYRRMGFKAGYCPEAERYYGEAVSIPLYYGLNESDQDRVIEAIRRAVA
jgi:UDP-4-amino-4,6-dideoxy-N-acetyl-beta-L-altrosamine transaminase